jgi:short-subunit dehydrogenase
MSNTRELALVTGASSGVGVEFARLLAKRNCDLILTARREERLAEVRDELSAQHSVNITNVVQDLGAVDGARQLIDRLESDGLEPTILINNAGYGLHKPLIEEDPTAIRTNIETNVMTVVRLAQHYSQVMVAREHGYILNMASFIALQPVPDLAVYAGTKAFVLNFSRALREEVKEAGVRVSAICPGFFQSEFFERADWEPPFLTRLFTMKVDTVARAGIRGMFRGKAKIVPGWQYKTLAFLSPFSPSWLNMLIGKDISGYGAEKREVAGEN